MQYYFANDTTFKENGDWGNKEKKVYKLDAYGERVPQLDENGNQKLEDAMRNYGSEYVLDRFAKRENGGSVARIVENHVNQYLQPKIIQITEVMSINKVQKLNSNTR